MSKQKPLSFSLCPDNIAYINEQYQLKHRNRSHWLDDLVTHLRARSPSPDKATPKTMFAAPTSEMVLAYMDEKMVGNRIEAEKFVDFYESKGWVVGKAKMKDWKAAVRNWTKDKPTSPNNGHSSVVNQSIENLKGGF